MKKFQFNLQKLLEIREKKEELQKVKLAKASGEYQVEVNKVENIKNNVKNYKNSILKGESFSIENLRMLDYISTNAEKAIKNLEPVIEEKRKKMEREIEIYNQLRKEKKIVELIKEKKYKQYLEETGKEEQKIIDEIGKNTYMKNKADSLNSEN
ncbi:MAG: flagellar export protein FliJ [Brevinematales bacterium]|nr:flagellar export protein FliJ [Brevinematales bacterium]